MKSSRGFLRSALSPRWAALLGTTALTIALAAQAADPEPTTKGARESAGAAAKAPSLAVNQYTLDNGLTVLMSEDHAYPGVAIEMVYLVGSGHERPGRTGFAHLFEHLMFQGSGHYNQEYFTPYEPIGADVNGTTNRDRTNYYQQVPSQYGELPLWMESDRMRSLADVLTQEKLDNQRDVVKNERRQRYEIAPYGMDFWYLSEALFPEGHPYRHTPIGSHEDLTAATLHDVRAFFKRYYVPKNAGLVIVGDFNQEEMKPLVEKYFGDIPAGERAPTPKAERPVLEAPKHLVAEDQIELPRVYLAFHSPALFEAGDADLDLLSSVLSSGKSSRLFHSLVYDQKLAKDVAAFQISQKLQGIYVIRATAAPGTDLDELAVALEAELKKALSEPPSEDELTRARSRYKKDFFHRLETYTSRASLLGSYFLFTGQGDYIQKDYERYVDTTPQSVQNAGRKYLQLERSVRLDFIPGDKKTPLREVLTPDQPSDEDAAAKAGAQ